MLDNISHGQIRAIIFREGDLWVAQCVEYDIGAQGRTLPEVTKRLELTVELELEESIRRHGAPFRGVPAAPSSVGDMWESQAGAFTPAASAPADTRPERDRAKVGLELALCA